MEYDNGVYERDRYSWSFKEYGCLIEVVGILWRWSEKLVAENNGGGT